ncbi:MAG: 1-acyl-sn-glycerol-3-phosphate acyltransferase [Flammeovirgaceae bacterium]|jgi:1-acyl-sn-glycerol-3-phosphate acyltransferase
MSKAITEEEWALKVEENKKIYHEHFDQEYSKSLVNNVLVPLDKYYFRTKSVGFEEWEKRNIPNVPVIYISNHSGMAFPWDGMMLTSTLLKRANFETTKSARPLVAPMLTKTKLVNPFMVDEFWRRAGAIDATYLNAETMMHYQDSDFFLYPEGVPGIGKGYNNKYKLQRFATSFLRMSLKYKADVIPIVTVNGEYINPYSYSFEWANKIARKVGIPFLPISFMLILAIFQPWLFYFGFPAQLTFVKGRRMSPYKMIDKEYADITEEEIKELTKHIHDEMQKDLDEAVKLYGKNPFKWGEFFKTIFSAGKLLPFVIPSGWPILFREHASQFEKKGKDFQMEYGWLNMLKYLFKNPLAISLFIPVLGLIPMIIIGAMKVKK